MIPTRLSLVAYTSQRCVAFGKAPELVGHAQRGVPAGCALVTCYIQAYTQPSLDWLIQETWQHIPVTLGIDLFIGDVGLTFSGKRAGDVVPHAIVASENVHS